MDEMKPLSVDRPAIKEMIARRSGGHPDYVAGVRAYLELKAEPVAGSIAHRGYMDAHDMSEYLSEVHADLRADEEEEIVRLATFRKQIEEARRSAKEKPAQAAALPVEIKAKPSARIRI